MEQDCTAYRPAIVVRAHARKTERTNGLLDISQSIPRQWFSGRYPSLPVSRSCAWIARAGDLIESPALRAIAGEVSNGSPQYSQASYVAQLRAALCSLLRGSVHGRRSWITRGEHGSGLGSDLTPRLAPLALQRADLLPLVQAEVLGSY